MATSSARRPLETDGCNCGARRHGRKSPRRRRRKEREASSHRPDLEELFALALTKSAVASETGAVQDLADFPATLSLAKPLGLWSPSPAFLLPQKYFKNSWRDWAAENALDQ